MAVEPPATTLQRTTFVCSPHEPKRSASRPVSPNLDCACRVPAAHLMRVRGRGQGDEGKNRTRAAVDQGRSMAAGHGGHGGLGIASALCRLQQVPALVESALVSWPELAHVLESQPTRLGLGVSSSGIVFARLASLGHGPCVGEVGAHTQNARNTTRRDCLRLPFADLVCLAGTRRCCSLSLRLDLSKYRRSTG